MRLTYAFKQICDAFTNRLPILLLTLSLHHDAGSGLPLASSKKSMQADNNANANAQTCQCRLDAGIQTSTGKQQKSIQADRSPDAEPKSCEDKGNAKEAAASKLTAAGGHQPTGQQSDSSLALAKLPSVDGTSRPSSGADKSSNNADKLSADKLSADKASDDAATQGKSSGDPGDKTSEQSSARHKVRLPDAPLFVAGSPAGADRTVQWVQQFKLEHPECSDAEAFTGELLCVPSVLL